MVSDLDPLELVESIYADLARGIGKSRSALEVEGGIAEFLAMTTQMITSGVPSGEGDTALAGFLGALIEVARRHATPQALAVLRALSLLPGTPAVEVAGAAAADLADSGIADRAWVAKLGQLRPTTCLRYGHVDGSQESLLAGFSYGNAEHAVTVLIDHELGGGIKDCWVTDQPQVARQQILTTTVFDPLVEVGPIDWVRAEKILSATLSRPVCAVDDSQVSDTAVNIAVLRRRVAVLGGESWHPAGLRARPPRPPSAGQASLFGCSPESTGVPTPVTRQPAAGKTAEARPGPAGAALQLKVTLAGSKPPIWRRLTMPESITLARLHELIQIAFGWTDSHLHLFEIGGEEYGPSAEGIKARSERVRLSRLVSVGDRFSYVYDFGDDWRHTVEVEKRLPSGTAHRGVRCVAGRRAGPPDDCGGVYGYQDLLQVIADPERADEELLSWAAEALGTTVARLPTYDPARFDQAGINATLLEVRP